MVFKHSIKVPTQYKIASSILQQCTVGNQSVKSLVFNSKHAKIPNLLAVLNKYCDNKDQIERLIRESKILVRNPRLQVFLCRILVTELMFGSKRLIGTSKPVSCVMSYKDQFLKFMDSEVACEFEKDVLPRYVRLNTNIVNMVDVAHALEYNGWKCKKTTFASYNEYLNTLTCLRDDEYIFDLHVKNVLVFSPKTRKYWAQNDLVNRKWILLQDKATCFVAQLLAPPPNSIVLDTCAAPGMKTVHMANLMQNRGKIYAVEKSRRRFALLKEMLVKTQTTIVQAINADILRIDSIDVPDVQYVLIDPSCSGSGLYTRVSLLAGEHENETRRLQRLSRFQVKILTHIMISFPNVKKIVYSTCSIRQEENEEVIIRALRKSRHFQLVNIADQFKEQWCNRESPLNKDIGGKCIYALPERDSTHGIFIAVLERILPVIDETEF